MRSRPGMYIGGVNRWGLMNLLDEVVTSLVEWSDTCPERVWCKLAADGAHSVELRGGAIGPVEPEDLETDVGDFGINNPVDSMKVVSAFSNPLHAEVVRDGRQWTRTFAAGLPAGPLEVKATAAPSHLRIHYQPDRTLFPAEMRVEYLQVCGRAQEWAVFHPHVRFTIEQEDDGQRRDFHYPAGLLSLAQEVAHQWWERPWAGGASNVWRCAMKEGNEAAEAVFVHRPCGPATVHAFVNGARTSEEGSHTEGLRSGVAAVAASWDDADPETNPFYCADRRDPLANVTVLLAVQLDEPEWRYSTRDVLYHDRARDLVHRMILATLPNEIRRAAGGT
jgi:DNA gyrase/topoisomerase IV subunit B